MASSIQQGKTGRGGNPVGFVRGGNGGSRASKPPVPTNIGPTPGSKKPAVRKPPSA